LGVYARECSASILMDKQPSGVASHLGLCDRQDQITVPIHCISNSVPADTVRHPGVVESSDMLGLINVWCGFCVVALNKLTHAVWSLGCFPSGSLCKKLTSAQPLLMPYNYCSWSDTDSNVLHIKVLTCHEEGSDVTLYLLIFTELCETCYLMLKEEDRLTVFKNGVLRKIFGPKRQ
jgi:hypothetical protein